MTAIEFLILAEGSVAPKSELLLKVSVQCTFAQIFGTAFHGFLEVSIELLSSSFYPFHIIGVKEPSLLEKESLAKVLKDQIGSSDKWYFAVNRVRAPFVERKVATGHWPAATANQYPPLQTFRWYRLILMENMYTDLRL